MQQQISQLAAENERLKGNFVCQICMTDDVNKVIVPCGHMLCDGCLGRLRDRKCPFCRQAFTTSVDFHKSYLAENGE